MRRAPQVGIVRGLEPVPAQPGHPDVVGVQRDDADGAEQEESGHHEADPQRAREQREHHADRHHHDQVTPDEPAAPAGVGQLVPDPLPVPVRQPGAEREQHLTSQARVPRDPAHGDQSVSSQIAAPAETVWPTSTASPVTVPSLCAVSGCSIFIASSTTITSPTDTRCPSAAAILMIVPCIGLIRVSPRGGRPPPDPRCARPGGRPPGTPRSWGEPVPPIPPRGTITSSRFPPTSTVSRSRSAGGSASAVSCAGMGVSNSVSIQRVCTRNTPSGAANAGSATTARWKGSTVGIPPTSNSARARAERCRASARLAPVTISLAMSESYACGTVIPAAYPASSRTPGPDGGFHTVIMPGAGRKLRPGSAALIRNSIECPRAGGSS